MGPLMKRKVITAICILLFSSLVVVYSNSSIELAYVIEVPGWQTAITHHPPYLWINENELLIPIQYKRTKDFDYPLQDVYLLHLNIKDGTCRFGKEFKSVRNVEFYLLQNGDENLVSVVSKRTSAIPGSAPKSIYIDYLVNHTTLAYNTIEYDSIKHSLLDIQPTDFKQYPDMLLILEEESIYSQSNTPISMLYDWEKWGNFYVALGKPLNESDTVSIPVEYVQYDLRAYDISGKGVFVFPNVSIVPENARAIPTILQVSPDEHFLMVSPQNFRGHTDSTLSVNQ
jgi:hypothetical protein